MKLLGRFILSVFSNAIAILAAAYFIAGFNFTGNFIELSLAAVILTFINVFLRPIIKLIFGPLIVITFGFFILIINALIIYALDFLNESITINGLLPLIFATLIIGIVNILVNFSAKSVSRD